MSTHTKPVSDYCEHKCAKEDKRTHDIETVLALANQLQRRLGQLEQESKQMRDAINDIGQHLCESNGLKLRWEGIKGLDGDV
jgi:hypothetical protein